MQQMLIADNIFATKIVARLTLTLFIMDTSEEVLWQTFKTLFAMNKSFVEILTGNPLKCKMDNSILIVTICMGYFIRMKRVNVYYWLNCPF